jgi:diacylglycerol kinase (ATP)
MILNPEAGGLRSEPTLLTRLNAHPRLRGVEVVPTRSAREVRAEARKARDEGRTHVLVGGGDGTFHEVVNGLLDGLDPESLPPCQSLPVLAALPLGTGNDLARALDTPLAPWKMLDLLDWDRVRPMDLIHVQGPENRWCVNAVTGGMAVQPGVTAGAGSKAAMGLLAYVRQGLASLEGEIPLYDLVLILEDQEPRTFRAQSLVAANGRFIGGAVPVAPEARLDDGLLDLLVVPDLDMAEMGLLLPRLLVGKHQDHPTLFTERARHLEFRANPALHLSLDGELTRAEEAILRVVPGAVRILVGPAGGERAFQD